MGPIRPIPIAVQTDLCGLFAIVGHLLNGHHLTGVGVPGLMEKHMQYETIKRVDFMDRL